MDTFGISSPTGFARWRVGAVALWDLSYQPQGNTQMSDAVNHPDHYNHDGIKCGCGQPIECIQVAENFNFNRGNALKYIWRAGSKDDEVQDLRKANWYVHREIERILHDKPVSDKDQIKEMISLANRIACMSLEEEFLQQQVDLLVDDFINGLQTLRTMSPSQAADYS